MAWTNPRTWVTGEVVTSTVMNAHVRDNLAYLHGDAGVVTIGDTILSRGWGSFAGSNGGGNAFTCIGYGAYWNGVGWTRLDAVHPSWLISLDGVTDNYGVYRAAAGAGAPGWVQLLSLDSVGMLSLQHVTGNSSFQVNPNGLAAGSPSLNVYNSAGTLLAHWNRDRFVFDAWDVGWIAGNLANAIDLRNVANSAFQTLRAGSIQSFDGTTLMRVHRHPYGNERHVESGAIPAGGGTIGFTDAFAAAPRVTVGFTTGGGTTYVSAVSTTGATFASSTWSSYSAGGDWIAEGRDT
jgi:hypothetical protein